MRAPGGLLAAVCAVALAACATTAPPGEVPAAIPLARALQLHAPALAASHESAAFVWTGFDAQDVHLDARRLDGGALNTPVILPLPPTHPLDVRLVPGIDGALHLFWRDAAESGAGNRLYSALLRPDLTVERGPIEVSTASTFNFTALADDVGGAWVVWSEGPPAEPRLTLSRVSARGLPAPPAPLPFSGQYPALAAWTDGPLLVWEQAGQLWRARPASTGLTDVTAVSATVGRRAGDSLDSLWAARCGALLCVGWNVVRQDGTVESWLASGDAGATVWDAPRPLDGLSWLTPEAQAAAGPLRAAAQTEEGLSVLILADGHVSEQTLVAPGVRVQGAPGLLEIESGGLLAWAEPGADYAQLYVQTAPLPE
jgi:hypothetical protein